MFRSHLLHFIFVDRELCDDEHNQCETSRDIQHVDETNDVIVVDNVEHVDDHLKEHEEMVEHIDGYLETLCCRLLLLGRCEELQLALIFPIHEQIVVVV